MPGRLQCEVLQKEPYTNTLTFTFTFILLERERELWSFLWVFLRLYF